MKPSVPDLLTFNGGYVDTASFLLLQGLFTAHVTGNFVTLGAALVHGTSGALAKTLALPVFCIVVAVARTVANALTGDRGVNALLAMKTGLFTVAAALALGPFANADSGGALVTGMCLVAAMAIQNSVQRIHFSRTPPSTVMTGTTTQIMMDLADLVAGRLPAENRAVVQKSFGALFRSVAVFAVGCAVGAVVYAKGGTQVLVVPPLIAAAALARRLRDATV